jgi:hypothetical protein
LCANRSGRLYDLDEPRRGIFPRVSSVQSVHVREEEEIIRVDHRRGDRRKRIVITEFYFLEELSGVRPKRRRESDTYADRDGVIFIHYRHHAHRE